MNNNQQSVTVSILDKDYQIACPPNEREALHQAAKDLDARMRVIRSSGSVIGLERIAIMAALNLCYDLQKFADKSDEKHTASLERLLVKLDNTLG